MTSLKLLGLSGVLLVTGCLSALAAGPIFDPFLESFQVGGFSNSRDMVLSRGFPAALWTPCRVDSIWLDTARTLVEGAASYPDPVPVLADWQGLEMMRNRLEPWRRSRLSVLGRLAGKDPGSGALPPAGQGLLGQALLAQEFFLALARADTTAAIELADQLAAATFNDPEQAAPHFIWGLRGRALRIYSGRQADDPEDVWPELFSLGPYDAGSGWAIWRAHQMALKRPLLNRNHRTMQQAAVLASLGTSGLKSGDLAASGFPLEIKAGLGAKTLRGADRVAFLNHYARPPWDFQAQGWWVAGKRATVTGNAAAYESLAGRDDLRSGWRMDVWRRASELRLLKGQWTPGLADLKMALGLARLEAGSTGLRRRLRQWVEQALALAVAAGDSQNAAIIFNLGDRRLPSSERNRFLSRAGLWYDSARSEEGKKGSGLTSGWRTVAGGQAPALSAGTEALPLPDEASLRLTGWKRWAAAGNDTTREALAGASTPARARALALGIIARELGSLLPADDCLDMVLFRDVYILTAGRGGAPPSGWPEFSRWITVNPRIHHGLLGLALALQDMRAVVGMGQLIDEATLPSVEKLRFLYPIPVFGPTRQAFDHVVSEPALLLAVARNESLFDAGARSRAGALGWMQIMPFHLDHGGGVWGAGHWANPAVSIAKGDALLEENRRRFRGDPYVALAAYNAGPSAAKRWQDQLGGSAAAPLYLAWIGYPETRGYVEKVLMDRAIYAGILAQERESTTGINGQ